LRGETAKKRRGRGVQNHSWDHPQLEKLAPTIWERKKGGCERCRVKKNQRKKTGGGEQSVKNISNAKGVGCSSDQTTKGRGNKSFEQEKVFRHSMPRFRAYTRENKEKKRSIGRFYNGMEGGVGETVEEGFGGGEENFNSLGERFYALI